MNETIYTLDEHSADEELSRLYNEYLHTYDTDYLDNLDLFFED